MSAAEKPSRQRTVRRLRALCGDTRRLVQAFETINGELLECLEMAQQWARPQRPRPHVGAAGLSEKLSDVEPDIRSAVEKAQAVMVEARNLLRDARWAERLSAEEGNAIPREDQCQ